MPTRRGHGEGSIYQRKDGRWVGMLELERHPDGRRNRRTIYGKTQAEVIDSIATEKRKLKLGLDLKPQRFTVAAQLDDWLSTASPKKSVNTISVYRWAIGHLNSGLGRERLDKLTPSTVTRFFNQKIEDGLAPASVNRLRSVLNQALRQAEIDGIVGRNVATLTDAVPQGYTTSRSMTESEAKSLLSATTNHRLGALFLVELTMGLRPGEAAGLTWAKVDLDTAVLHVRYSMKNNAGKLELGEVKTRRSLRSLSIPTLTLESLIRRRQQQRIERLAAGPAWHGNDLVFCTAVGAPLDPSNLRRTLDKVAAQAGLGHWTPRELRHSAVSLMSAAGVLIEAISDQVGHETTRTTQSVYRHILNPVQPHALVMDEILAAAAPP